MTIIKSTRKPYPQEPQKFAFFRKVLERSDSTRAEEPENDSGGKIMNQHVDRRTLMSTMAAIPAVVAPGAALTAANAPGGLEPSASGHPDSILIALGVELQNAVADRKEAYNACDEATDRYNNIYDASEASTARVERSARRSRQCCRGR